MINVLQPVERPTLKRIVNSWTAKLLGKSTTSTSQAPDLDALVKDLLRRGAIVDCDGKISVTSVGLDTLSRLHLGSIRDRNRFFFLKSSMKSEYNSRKKRR